MKDLDYGAIKDAANKYSKDMTAFLRAMISHPSESSEEGEVVACIKAEMEKLGFDEVKVDGLGNVMGFMGTGDKIIAIDGHIDTVGIGNRDNWDFDPYEGFEDDQLIGGRGGSDQEGGVCSGVYAAKIMKDMNLIPEGYKVMVVGTVQEEDCDGMCWQYIYNVDKIKPEFVISTEPTDGGIYRGHRGRMEIRVDVKGVSCHGSAPERGDNAIYKMADIINDVRALNNNGADESTAVRGLVKMLNPKYNPDHYEDARFLGRGTCTVSQIYFTSPSRCAVADSCAISIDRRMTAGETYKRSRIFLPSRSMVTTSRSPCTCMTVLLGLARSMRLSLTSQHGSTKSLLHTSRHLLMLIRHSLAISALVARSPWQLVKVVLYAISGPSPQTAFLFRVVMVFLALALDQVLSLRHTLQMRLHSSRIFLPVQHCMLQLSTCMTLLQ